jgi:succinate dehydrogenase / fumarate reductase iron-sulfur subunit
MAAQYRRALKIYPKGGEPVGFKLKIKRQEHPDAAPYWQTFVFEAGGEATVAAAIREINDRIPLTDSDGDRAMPISWECACLQRKCGACAMLINGTPRLACSAFFSEFPGSEIVLEPLGKFPVISDLTVDRSAIFEWMKQARLWLEEKAYLPGRRHEASYQSARCLMCGCCLEVCPNFGAAGDFGGALLSVNAYRALEQSSGGGHKKEMSEAYRKLYFSGCGGSLACHQICPLKLPVEELLLRSNAVAVWGR